MLNKERIKNAIKKILKNPLLIFHYIKRLFFLVLQNRKRKLRSFNITTKENYANRIHIVAVIHLKFTNTYDTLYKECQKNKKFVFTFVLIPSKQEGLNFHNSIDELTQMMTKKKYSYILGYDKKNNSYLNLKSLKPDIVLFQTPYDSQRISPLFSLKYIHSFAKVFCISYGYTMVDYSVPPYNTIFYKGCSDNRDGDLVESTPLARYYSKFIPNAIPVGYLKCEKFISNPKLCKKKIFKNFSIVWKPRWIGVPSHSNFLRYVNFFIDFAENNDITLIFVKHPLLESQLIDKKILSYQEVKQIFAKMKKTPNIKIITDEDFLDYVMGADLFIGDYCSTIIEFCLTKKPIIYTPTKVALNECAIQIAKRFYIAKSKNDIAKYINMIRNGNDYLFDKRQDLSLITDSHRNKKMSISQFVLNYFNNIIKK